METNPTDIGTGFIEVAPSPQDWKSADGTGVIGAPIKADGDWREFQSPGEWQRDMRTLFETEACVSFSANDTLETYGNYCIKSGLWHDDLIAWLKDKGYFNAVDGSLNFSDRFTAKMSGTTKNGNNLPTVWESIRVNGLVPEIAWTSDFEAMMPDASVSGETQVNWDIYYAEIPDSIKALGKEFLSKINPDNPSRAIQWEWIAYPGITMTPEAFAQQLKTSPIQLATAVCMPWNNEVIHGCGAGAGHATMLSCANDTFHILDHYEPFNKQFTLDYVLTYATRAIILPVPAVTVTPVKFTFTKNLFIGMKNDDVKMLQKVLGVQQTGFFGALTFAAVMLYQHKNNLPATGFVGVMTRGLLNK